MVCAPPTIPPSLSRRLLDWFAVHARALPWRVERTPYRVWVAEVMLQQTRAETVVPYYERFMARFPTIEALAAAPLEDVLRVWEGLGYYARARHLHESARVLVASRAGQLPGTYEGLLALPGVGRYVAGAVASLACGQDVPAVDGNARRVLCRLFEVRDDVTRLATQRMLERLAADLLPPGEAGRFNEALMELGATLCTPRAPRCLACPLADQCRAYLRGNPEALPVRGARRAVPHYDVAAAALFDHSGRVLVAQRRADEMLGGLWEFPGGKREPDETLIQCLIRELREELGVTVQVEGEQAFAVISHAYSHFRMTLHAFRCRLQAGQPQCLDCAALRWVALAELDDLPMSVVDRKVARALANLS